MEALAARRERRRFGTADVAGGAHAACAPLRAGAMFGLSGAELAAAEADAARSLAAADRFIDAAERQLRAPRAAVPLAPGGAWRVCATARIALRLAAAVLR